MVLHFTFRSVIHSELIFERDVSSESSFFSFFLSFFFCMWMSVVLAPFIEKTIFAPLYCLSHLSKISWLYVCIAIIILNKLSSVWSNKNEKNKVFILPSLILSSVVFLSLCRSKFLIRKRYWVLSNAFLCLSRW